PPYRAPVALRAAREKVEPVRRARTRTRAAAVAGALLTAAGLVAGCRPEADNAVTVYCVEEQYVPHIVATCNEEANGEYQIVHRQLPRDADGQREQMVRRLAAGDTDLDLLGLDVTWVPEFAEAKWLAEWTGEDKASVEEDTLEI